jgi:hypothetical protein
VQGDNDGWRMVLTERKRALVLTVALMFFGYIGAASYYGDLVGLNSPQNSWECPVCLHITQFGDPVEKFVRRVIGVGTLNALLFVLVGWLLMWSFRLWRHLRHQGEQQ